MIVYCCISLVISILVLLICRGLWQKLLASNIVSTFTIITIVVYSAVTGNPYGYDIAFAFALLSFVGTQFFARFVAGRGWF